MLHRKAILGDIHKVHNFEYLNAAARESAILSTDDIGKVAWQKDNDSYWALKSTSPLTWNHFGGYNPDGTITEPILEVAIRSAGVVTLPSITNNGDGSITVGTGSYSLYDNPNYEGFPSTYEITGGTFILADNSPSYLLASYNNANPALEVVTSVPPANTTDSDRVPIYSAYRAGTDIHYFDWDHLSQGLAEKINQRLRRTDRFHIDSGLALSESPTRQINISSGGVWAGANLVALNTIDSSSPETHFYYHNAGNWVRTDISQYNNTQYDDGTNLQTLSNSRYAVNWIYRSVQTIGSIYVVLGGGDYSLLQAQASAEPVKPLEIATQAVLVGRIIVQKNAATAVQIDKVIETTFGVSSVVHHNDLSDKQGGTAGEYYHLTANEYAGLYATRTVTTNTSALLTDRTLRADSSSSNVTVTLPDATTCTGRIFCVKRISKSNSVTVVTTSSQTIDGSLSVPINIQYQSLTFQSNGTNWDII